jgi:cysteine desulfurase
MAERFVYADNAATTPLAKIAFRAMEPWLTEKWGNPSSIYETAREARRAVEQARADIAAALGADPKEIYFTSGGTESDNWAIKSTAKAFSEKGKHLITSPIEHHAVTETMESLKSEGYEVTVLPVDKYGLVDPAALERTIRPDTVLITIMTANNEIGTIQPIKELAAIARRHGVVFHTDAVQAVGHIPIDVRDMDVDLLSLSSHKFRGPQGVGALYIRKGIRIPPLLHGGGHESGLRSGTENVAGICGMAAALKHAVETMPETMARLTRLRNKLTEKILQIPYTQITGHPEKRLPGLVSVVINFIEGESIVLMLDRQGIYASSGSACTSGSLDPSHVLLAIGLPHEVAHGSLRFSFGEDTTEEDIDYIAEKLPPIVEKLRAMSPVWKG